MSRSADQRMCSLVAVLGGSFQEQRESLPAARQFLLLVVLD